MTCRICGSATRTVLDLGAMPLANRLKTAADAPEKRFPLALEACAACGGIQLSHCVDAADLYDDYLYITPLSPSLESHHDNLVYHQRAQGYLPERALRVISDRLTIHWAQVFGAAGLGGFRLLPAEGHVVTVCSCAACRFAGGSELLEALTDELGIAPGEATPDGAFSLETSADVGAGAIAPAIRIDTLVYGPITPDQARHLVSERRRAAGPTASAATGAASGARA